MKTYIRLSFNGHHQDLFAKTEQHLTNTDCRKMDVHKVPGFVKPFQFGQHIVQP